MLSLIFQKSGYSSALVQLPGGSEQSQFSHAPLYLPLRVPTTAYQFGQIFN